MRIEDFGWRSFFQRQLETEPLAGMQPGRVRATGAGSVDLLTEAGGVTAAVPQSVIPPVVGDWVIYDTRTALLARVLERESEFARKRAGETSRKQVLAANVDVVGIVCGLDGDLNPRRIERYLIAVAESGAEPLIILNKADLCARPDEALDTVRAAAAGAPIVVVSARSGTGLEALSLYLEPGSTTAFAGSSGVGKSTLVNRLLGEDHMETAETRDSDHKGRHTTTRRELLPTPQGWLLLDMPGIREIQPWSSAAAVGNAFPEIVAAAKLCRFRDCRHEGEPGCGVDEGIEEGRIGHERLIAYNKLQLEQAFLKRKVDEQAALTNKRQEKRLHKMIRNLPKRR